jgi:hypothetical protein
MSRDKRFERGEEGKRKRIFRGEEGKNGGNSAKLAAGNMKEEIERCRRENAEAVKMWTGESESRIQEKKGRSTARERMRALGGVPQKKRVECI